MELVLKRLRTGHDWLTALVDVDELSLEFHETHQLHVIQACNDLGELKQIASALTSCHFAMKRMLGEKIRSELPRLGSG